ncbi:MAG: aminotransferase class I/II-fold pyridoxal phosphate-dependent enzyme [Gemmatimonadaceae bacterium]|nr:aminotransferase class I/II-fold pyridoxal phosphate-dependent enzyme [Gemmatimonadaceae bacterium]NUO94848.1 aminotransferase class I/II-fold pyridoxal phosphate-dependent enzyme [Gemmatimonadaceae bacterium]NUP57283.1 aminotransferase class I/II-fold pyridoxal phosphate-dependent enzyme [Gemmatimonadaceae bacterium]NUP70721.1 aminotransferase class I/II-fold pyridoxal phosphate-dependent enzyme [Gemmatimonadaceae bacterium]NUR35280.1 aminotransferase class I/II-fold pyridoxal phosphate-dep
MPLTDLRSDTVTRPTPAMRRAMAEAEVGDDVLDGDPTVLRLEARVAALLGKEAALFFPTGTMANQAGLAVLTTPGTEALLDANAHIIHWEMAGAAALWGVQVRGVPAGDGRSVMNADDLARAIRPPSIHAPATSVVCVENTHNGAGGKVTPLAQLRALREVADAHGLPVHMDGARLWNASAATGTPLADFARCATTVMLSFSKGLGCPVGAILVCDAATRTRAHVIRKRLGGGMRQSGILAAAALHALDAHLERLVDDHANAKRFADGVDGAAGARVVPPDTNIVMIDLPAGVTSTAVVAAAKEGGVLITPWNLSRVRAVAHLDADTAAVTRAAEVVRAAIERAAG